MVDKKIGIGALLIIIISASAYYISQEEEIIETIEGNDYEIITKEVFEEKMILENYTCNVTETIIVNKNISAGYLGPLNGTCNNKVGIYCNNTFTYLITTNELINKTSTCLRKIRINVSKGFIPIGKIKVNGTIKEKDGYFCGADSKGTICDERYDEDGGTGDGNGDGICQEGETCIRI